MATAAIYPNVIAGKAPTLSPFTPASLDDLDNQHELGQFLTPASDTSPEIAAMVRARLMALSGAERFRMGVQMFDAARRMVLASLPADLPEIERKRLLFERLYGGTLPAEVKT